MTLGINLCQQQKQKKWEWEGEYKPTERDFVFFHIVRKPNQKQQDYLNDFSKTEINMILKSPFYLSYLRIFKTLTECSFPSESFRVCSIEDTHLCPLFTVCLTGRFF